jgi:hypothetical protein
MKIFELIDENLHEGFIGSLDPASEKYFKDAQLEIGKIKVVYEKMIDTIAFNLPEADKKMLLEISEKPANHDDLRKLFKSEKTKSLVERHWETMPLYKLSDIGEAVLEKLRTMEKSPEGGSVVDMNNFSKLENEYSGGA